MYLFHIDFDGYKFLVTLFRQLGKICVYVNDTKAFVLQLLILIDLNLLE